MEMNSKKIKIIITLLFVFLVSIIALIIFIIARNDEIKYSELIKLTTGASLKVYKSDDNNNNGRSIIVFPGGSYAKLADKNEGTHWAPFLRDLGYTSAVLYYTVPPKAPDGPLKEALEAMKYLRNITTTGIIGVMGFSAGGHLASTVATHTHDKEEEEEEHPSFQILFYPVITMDANYTHARSRLNILGSNPTNELINLYSNEKQVTTNTPPAYITWTDDDTVVSPLNSINYADALKKADVPVYTKNFPKGEHGFGFSNKFEYHNEMIEDLTKWFENMNKTLNEKELLQENKNKKK
ncbi:alpha/beta-hydrolase [Anaeromyces robustus]|uniref:Alpha/beta-hydrolase n=1 Tax=Anaeromyces robustus TaxID=1754192 RepID=A0A1Y1WUK0_9FUNG|nr:alpha/beta-hydrolase [Anaeromyces robustus]|eukprot:ORX76896.1 alpha/beta-hydrolase [Anaeromyces robustus]